MEDIRLSPGAEVCFLIREHPSLEKYKDDPEAFIFTLKNPHSVAPTRFMKREQYIYAIRCQANLGPVLGNADIYIADNCDKVNSCSIFYDGEFSFECDHKYRRSLFVNTNRPDEANCFSVLDYEVYARE